MMLVDEGHSWSGTFADAGVTAHPTKVQCQPDNVGEAQYYLMTTKDSSGKPLEGRSRYRMNVPANAPVTQYWSMTVYNRATHAFIRNAPWVGRSSQTPGLQKNGDGSLDLYFGPAPPATRESNWVPTDADGRFEVLARFYAPT